MRNHDSTSTSPHRRSLRPARLGGLRSLAYLAISIAALLVISACQSATATPVPEDFQISLDRAPCFGTCPVYSMTVSADGSVVYDGEQFVEAEGRQTATLPAEEVEALFQAVQAAGFFELADEYTIEATDLPAITTTVTMDGRTKTVYHYGLGCGSEADTAPQGLCELEALLEEIPVSNGWVAAVS